MSFLDKAQQNLTSARELFGKEHYLGVANRAYYTSFQSILYSIDANLGMTQSVKSGAGSHEATIIMFKNVYSNQVSSYTSVAEIARITRELKKVRKRADYTLLEISAVEAKLRIESAERVLNLVSSL